MFNNIILFFLSVAMVFGGTTPTQVKESTVTATVPIIVGAQQAVYEKWSAVLTTCSACTGSGAVENKVTCSDCRGTGKLTICRSCSGYGQVMTHNIFDGAVCSKCGSTSNHAHWEKCQRCKGGGSEPEYTCQYCSGSGYKINGAKPCPTCSGSGMSGYKKGSFIATVTADANSLPADGKHTDGYWYILKNLIEE